MSVSRNRNELGILRELIHLETKYLKHYIGKVVDVNDPDTKGKVKVVINELGWMTPAEGAWCWPRQLHSMQVPKVDEYVEVYFIAGDRRRPCYFGQVSEIQGNIPDQYSAKTDRILFQDPDSGDYIKYDAQARKFKIQGTLDVNGNWEVAT